MLGLRLAHACATSASIARARSLCSACAYRNDIRTGAGCPLARHTSKKTTALIQEPVPSRRMYRTDKAGRTALIPLRPMGACAQAKLFVQAIQIALLQLRPNPAGCGKACLLNKLNSGTLCSVQNEVLGLAICKLDDDGACCPHRAPARRRPSATSSGALSSSQQCSLDQTHM